MKVVTRGLALVAALFVMLTALPVVVYAEPEAPTVPTTGTVDTDAASDVMPYADYLAAGTFAMATGSVKDSVYQAEGSSHVTVKEDPSMGTLYHMINEKKDDVRVNSTISFVINAPVDGAYNLAVRFANIEATAEDYVFELLLDGKMPFAECREMTVSALWEDDGGIRVLSNGDQVSAPQKQVEGVLTQRLYDYMGVAREPYVFYLTAGAHVFTMTATGRQFYVAGIQLEAPEVRQSYAEVDAGYKQKGYKNYTGKQIVIEAEKTLYRSDYSLTAKSDNGSASLSPHSAEESLINHMGGTGWMAANQEITWEFDVKESGLYKIGFAYKQATVTNGQTYRWLKIDGKTPFEEASHIAFPYGTGWTFKQLGAQNGEGEDTDPYLVYLEAGRHTMSMAVTLGDVSEVFARLKTIVDELGGLYLDMVMITSESPDANRDYELHKQIPYFLEALKTNYERLDVLGQEIGTTLQVNGELKGAVNNMARILRAMHDDYYEAHLQITNYYSAHQTLSAWLYDITAMDLSLDQIVLAAPEQEFVTPEAGFWEDLLFGIRRFIDSFTDGTSTMVSGDGNMPVVKIWVNWGRDQVKVLNTLIQDSFTPNNNVAVKVEQVNASVVQGIISNNSPDLYLHMARSETVNLAMRGVLHNLLFFDDYEEQLKQFHDGAELPYYYRDGCYGLPDTQGFDVMFYRKDILDDLNIKVPTTWDEFKTAMGILQRNNMSVYLPYAKNSSSFLPTLILQKGGKMYLDDKSATNLRAPESIQAFTEWTEYYTKYSLDQEANFTQKFRVGTMPIGIVGYTSYLTYKVAAPEITGKWTIAPIPGTVQEDGSINNVTAGSGTSCTIMKSSEDKEAAWKFIKWWVSAETQYRYSAECEAVLGETGRVASANMEGVGRMSWDNEALEVINKQWQNVEEIPEVPGSYYVGRSIDQAFWATKDGKSSSKEAIIDWAEICDAEIERKTQEYIDLDPDA
ncbi:MAG: extracellular solute-binding protein [Ruminococcaceae bacterium]|nr:extracellular solute-binding protein [Oscillospiraceae bacterium]